MKISLPLRSAPLLLAGLVLALAVPAFARGTAEQREACTDDAVRLCPDAIPDVDRTTACMKRHEAQLSRRCHRVFNAQLESPARGGERDLDGPGGRYAPRADDDDLAPRRAERRPVEPDEGYDVPRRADRYPAGAEGDDYDAPRRVERLPPGGPYGEDGYGPRQYLYLTPRGRQGDGRQVETPDDAY